MLQLALKNLKGRKAYSAIIIAAVAAAMVMTLFVLLMTNSVRQELENKRRMLGPDLAIVPKGSKERGHLYLSKGPPVLGAIPAGTLEQLGAFPEIEASAMQKRLGVVTVGTVQATLIGFDPATDFVVQPWIDKQNPGKDSGWNKGIALGVKVNGDEVPAAALPAVADQSAVQGGRLLETGAFMDSAIFIPRPLDEIAAEPSWILLRLRQGTSLDIAANRLEVNIAQIEVIPRPAMFKAINDQLYKLVEGGGFGATALLTIAGALLVTGAMFAVMIHERKREFGLLKAMGARNTFIFKLIMGEAAMLGSAGALLGAGMMAIYLLCVHVGLVSHEVFFALSSSAVVLRDVLAALTLTVVIAVLTALYPALAATRQEPYAAIRSGE